MTRARIVLLVTALGLSPCLAAQAAAQEAIMRPFQGLFGGDAQRPGGRQSLDFYASVYGGYDDNVAEAATGQPVDPRLTVPSWLAGAAASLRYSRLLSQRTSLGANVVTNGAYLFEFDELSWYGTSGAVGLGTRVGRNGQFSVGQSVGYQPYYQFGIFPPSQGSGPGIGLGQPLNPEYSLAGIASWRYNTSVSYGQRFSRRLSFDATYGLRYDDFVDPTVVDVRENQVGGRLTYQLWRFLSAYAGYYYRFGTYLDPQGEDQSFSDQTLDAGVGTGYGKAWQWEFALGPKTTVSFGVGTAFTTGVRVEELKPRLGVSAVGNALFTHWFNDRWQFRSGYDRRVEFQDWSFDPWMTNNAYATLGGYLSRRVSVSAFTGYGWGGRIGGPGTYGTWASTAGLQAALSSNTAVFVQYFYYRYLYEETVLPIGLPSEFDRQGVRFGLSFWVPLLR